MPYYEILFGFSSNVEKMKTMQSNGYLFSIFWSNISWLDVSVFVIQLLQLEVV